MEKTFLSKSRYCNCVQCVNILWLSKYRPECREIESNDATRLNVEKSRVMMLLLKPVEK